MWKAERTNIKQQIGSDMYVMNNNVDLKIFLFSIRIKNKSL